MSLKKQVILGVKWSTFSSISLALFALIKISVLTRFLDKADFGLIALVTFVLGFMNLFNEMGLTSAILHKQKISKQEYGSLYWLNILIGIIIYLILLLITPIISGFYEQPELSILIPLLGLNLIITSVGGMFRTIEQKDLNFKQITLIEVGAAFVSLMLAIYLAVMGYGVYSLIYSALLQFTITNVLYLIMGLKKHGLLIHFKLKETKPFLKIGMYQVGGQIVNVFNKDLDILIIGKMFTPELLGGYSLAKQLVMRPTQVLSPLLSKVASPTLAKFQNNIVELKRNYLRLINIIASINIPVYVFLVIFTPWIVTMLYGDGYENIVILVRILSIYMIIRIVGSPVGSLVIAKGRTDIEFYWNLFTIAVTPLCLYIGTKFGVIGAAIGISSAMLILYIPGWKILIHKLTGATLKEYVNACFVCNYSFLRNLRKS